MALTNAYPSPASNAPAIQAAIAAANHSANGVDFGPFMINTVGGWNYPGAWVSERGDNPITFLFGEPDLGQPGFQTLGGMVRFPSDQPQHVFVAPHPGDQTGLAVPASFDWVLDDKGSGNPDSISYFWPTPPAGYQGVGICFVGWVDPDSPNQPTSYCVADTALEPGVSTPFWSDAGQGWSHHSGNLSKVTLADIPPGDKMRIAPGTYLSDEATKSGTFGSAPWTLVGNKMLLPVTGASTRYPGPDNPDAAPFLHAVAILPGHAVADPHPYANSPFYYLSAESSWWIEGFNDPVHPTYRVSYQSWGPVDLGTITGLVIGPKSGVVIPASANGMVSACFNDEFDIKAGIASSDDAATLPIPPEIVAAGREYLQRSVLFTLWRCDGSIVTQGNYFAAHIRAFPSPNTAPSPSS